MKEKVHIDIHEVLKLKKLLREINQHSIDEVIFEDYDGEEIKIDQEIIDNWKFTGLNISDFVEMEIQDNPKYFPYIEIAKKKLEEAKEKCISNYARNSSGVLWEALWKFEDGKFMKKSCASGCFTNWHVFENEEQALEYMVNELKTIDKIK